MSDDEVDTASGGADAKASDGPVVCTVCGSDFESVSVHDEGLLVNMRDNDRYQRVCLEPVSDDDGTPLIRFFHHTHEQAGTDQPGSAGGRIP